MNITCILSKMSLYSLIGITTSRIERQRLKRAYLFLSMLVLSTFTPKLYAQDIPSNIYGHRLPYTWEAPMPGGKMRCTIHEDGRMTSIMVSGCFNCSGLGNCQVCGGTGGQYWSGIGIMPCGACSGSGRCNACGGKGYSVINTSTTQSGLTVGYDEHGNYYVAGSASNCEQNRNRNRSSDPVYHCCDKVTNFGKTLYHRCKNCGVIHTIGSHSCLK